MTLTTGTQLGPYEILSPLGAGGMGEVYAARDTRLERAVAIKVLPADYARDAERLRRFEQEARATSALNHQNILTIYDISQHDGAPFIVAELLEGEELRAQLNDGALSVRQALDYAQQITSGLAATHERGIVHRDLKPENLFVTKDGRVKILDFGLAKLRPQRLGGVDSQAPTLKPLTNPGVMMGTVGYMAPEQVRGQEADHRADIFAFGLILYEMLSGKRAFLRATLAETMTAILKEEPEELTTLNNKVPPPLERVVRRCLEKRPERRFQSAADLEFALEAVSTWSNSPLKVTDSQAARGETKSWFALHSRRERMAFFLTGLFFIACLAMLPGTVAHWRRTEPQVKAIRFSIPLPEQETYGRWLSISPDGQHLAYVGLAEGRRHLWLRPLDSTAAKPLLGTEDAWHPFWSPDNRSIGFFAQDKLKKVDLSGGPPQILCDAPDGRGGSWNADGVIIFAPSGNTGIYRVSSEGGLASPVSTLNESRQEYAHRFPYFLPDGQHFLYFALGNQQVSGIYLSSLDGKISKRLVSADSNAIYALPGYLIFAREGKLLAQPFTANQLQLTGEAVPLAEQVRINSGGKGAFAASDTGILACDLGNTLNQVYWVDRTGKLLSAVGPRGGYFTLSLSFDEKRVAVSRADSQSRADDIMVFDLARSTSAPLTFDPAEDNFPIWSPEGNRIVWSSNRTGLYGLYQKLASGAGPDEVLLQPSNAERATTDWSADGRFILYNQNSTQTKWDLWLLPLSGERNPLPFLQNPFNERDGCFSANGRYIAYSSDESGKYEIYVQSFPASGQKWPISTDGGSRPRWRRDGKELFYISAAGKLMAVEIKTGTGFEPGVPKELFDLTRLKMSTDHYAVTADGQKLLGIINEDDDKASSLTIVLNWTAEVKR